METQEQIAHLSANIAELKKGNEKLHLDDTQLVFTVGGSTATSSSQPQSQPRSIGLLPTPTIQPLVHTYDVTTSPGNFTTGFHNITLIFPPQQPSFLPVAPQERRYDPHHQHYHQNNQPRSHYATTNDLTKKVKVEALECDGNLDLGIFLDSLVAFEDYFYWSNMNKEQHVCFAKLKLVGSAKRYWQIILSNIAHTGQMSITLWDEMKEK